MTHTVSTNPDTALSDYRDHLFQCAPPLYDEPLVLAEGSGNWVTDANGDQYLDFFAGILTTSLGHCHPEVNQRVAEQMATLGHTSTLYLTERQGEMAKRLAAIAPGDLDTTFFTNSGTEAVETAIMLACQATERTEIITLRYAYSGRSLLATNMTNNAAWRPLAALVPGIVNIRSPYPYRCPVRTPCDDTCLDALANDLEEAIQTCTNGKPAAFFAETIQGLGGYIVPPPGYFQMASEMIRSYGGLFISDEVQAGFGRTGAKWFGIEHWNVVPDIMVMAKGIANGFPVGATTTRREIADRWTAKTISTYGGNPVSMAAALATNEIMVREDVPARSAERGAQVRDALDALANEFDWIGEVRGMGLMQALEIVEDRASKKPDPAKAKALLEAAKKERLLIGIGGLHGHVIRLGPSMMISEEDVDEALGRIGRACAAVA